MGAQRRRPIALDAGALIALEGARGRALARELADAGVPVVISAGALARAWRDPARQALLSALVRSRDTVVVPLDAAAAKACGALLRRTRTADVVDAHVVLCARALDARSVVTSDPADLSRLDPAARLDVI